MRKRNYPVRGRVTINWHACFLLVGNCDVSFAVLQDADVRNTFYTDYEGFIIMSSGESFRLGGALF